MAAPQPQDPPGGPFSSQHRINDLTLKVVSPSAVVYWGNHGLLDGGDIPSFVDLLLP